MSFVIADRVKETTTSTGAGVLTLAGAMAGFRTFASKCAVGDTLYYGLQAVDASGVPTGEWEIGLGAYSATNTLTRTTVLASSSSDAVVTLSAGTKQVFLTQPAAQVRWPRERLTSTRTYYVRTDGNDTNTGLADSAGGAFATIQKAVDVICTTLDMAGYTVTIQLGNGAYYQPITLRAYVGTEPPVINGNAATPANVLLSPTGAVINTVNAGKWVLQNFKLQNSGSGNGIIASTGSEIAFSGLNFGACMASHMAANAGGVITATGDYAVSGGSTYSAHAYANQVGSINTVGRTVTITGTPAFPRGWAWGDWGCGVLLMYGQTFIGSATGPRYTLALGSICAVNGAATTYLPGSTAGTTASGAQYA